MLFTFFWNNCNKLCFAWSKCYPDGLFKAAGSWKFLSSASGGDCYLVLHWPVLHRWCIQCPLSTLCHPPYFQRDVVGLFYALVPLRKYSISKTMPKNWCFSTVVLEKTLESPLDCKEIQPVHSEGDQPWDFFGRNDAKAETAVLWPPHAKSWLIGKDSDAGRGWGQEEQGTTEDEMAGWHHWLDGHEFEWTLGFGNGQGGLVCCDSWGHMTDWSDKENIRCNDHS